MGHEGDTVPRRAHAIIRLLIPQLPFREHGWRIHDPVDGIPPPPVTPPHEQIADVDHHGPRYGLHGVEPPVLLKLGTLVRASGS